MATEAKVIAKLRELGVEPLEDSCIVVQYAPKNRSELISRFIYQIEPFYVLQLCENDLVLAQMKWSGNVKDSEELLTIPFSMIKGLTVEESGLSYRIDIQLEDGDLELLAQQKELAFWRNSGILSQDNIWGTKSWHVDNLDGVLEKLQKIGTEVCV